MSWPYKNVGVTFLLLPTVYQYIEEYYRENTWIIKYIIWHQLGEDIA